MPTREIRQEHWVDEFNRFTIQHEGWLASLEIFGLPVGAQVEAKDLPLDSITADVKDSERTISISFGTLPDALVTRVIQEPVRVWLKMSDSGVDEALEIEGADGTNTLLNFHRTTVNSAQR